MDKSTILIVDDIPANINILADILSPFYKIKAAINGDIALKIASGVAKPDLILLDIMMPGKDGYEICRQLKSNPDTRNIPVIFVTAMSEAVNEREGLELGAIDYFCKPVNPSLLITRVKNHIALYDQSKHLENLVRQRTDELKKSHFELIQRLGRAAEYKDNQTGMHVIRVSLYSRLLAEKAGKDKAWCDLIAHASQMHDVGKIGIPDHILLKPGALTPEERKIMQHHTFYGADIIGKSQSPLLQMAYEIALYHHEKWDGSGYPHGLAGHEIPLVAGIVAIADVYDALMSPRPYKEAWSEEKALQLITDERGKHFNPELVDLFVGHLPELQAIRQKYSDEG